MKITQVRLGRISTPLRVPFKTALRTVNSVEDVIVELHTDTGAVGYGEAPPTGVITGDTTGAILGAIQDHIAPAILGRDLDEFEDLTAAVQKALVHNTSANAVTDIQLAAFFNRNGVAADIGDFVAVQIKRNIYASRNVNILSHIFQQFHCIVISRINSLLQRRILRLADLSDIIRLRAFAVRQGSGGQQAEREAKRQQNG